MIGQDLLYKTVIISDLHLGIKDSKVRELTAFLRQHPCKKLIMNGDIIDAWRLQKNARWKRRHTRFIKYLIKISSKTKIIYVRGNHDDFLDQIVPLGFGNLRVVSHYTLESKGKKYYIIHGDILDNITRYMVWISKFGASSYDILLTINRLYNMWRKKRGLKYKSISKGVKKNVKLVTSLISNFEQKAVKLARNLGYDGIICGHIHTPAEKMLHGIHYMNSGDWVESMSALVEDFEGNWEIKYFQEKGEVRESLKEIPELVHSDLKAGEEELKELQDERRRVIARMEEKAGVK
jgi:UDP-2,3-diacylglucosamine pyrophosphatase LpxH